LACETLVIRSVTGSFGWVFIPLVTGTLLFLLQITHAFRTPSLSCAQLRFRQRLYAVWVVAGLLAIFY